MYIVPCLNRTSPLIRGLGAQGRRCCPRLPHLGDGGGRRGHTWSSQSCSMNLKRAASRPLPSVSAAGSGLKKSAATKRRVGGRPSSCWSCLSITCRDGAREVGACDRRGSETGGGSDNAKGRAATIGPSSLADEMQNDVAAQRTTPFTHFPTLPPMAWKPPSLTYTPWR